MPIEQKNFNELIEYAINAATEIFGGKYPTNMQLLALLQSLASSQVIDDDALSLEGKEFHWSLCHWFDNLATLVTNKNENDLFQNMVHDLQMAFKTKEITFDPSSYLAMGVFLLNTSPEMREVMRDFKTLAEVLLTNPKDASLEIFRLFPRTPESFGENYTGKKGKRSKYCWPQKTRQIAKTAVSDDPLEIKVKHPDIPAESDLPISPSDELKTLKGADRSAEEGKNEPVLVKKDTFVLPTTEYREKDEVELSPHPTLENKRESLSSPRKSISIETAPQLRPSSDSHPSPLELNSGKSAPKPELYDIPIDTASYYEGSFPHQNLAQEKSLCSSLIVMITKLAQNNQTSVYLGKILATCKSVIQFYKTGVIITPTPYLNSFKSNFQRLMENSAEYVSLTELAESLNFFDEKLKTDFEFQEICTLWIDYLDDISTKDDYRNSDRGLYRGAMLIQSLQGHLHGKYPEESEMFKDEFASFLNRLLQDEEVNEFVESCASLHKQLGSTYKYQKLIEDMLLVVTPRMAVKFSNIRMATFAKSINDRWSLLVFHFNLPTISIVPKRIDISWANLYQIGIQDVNSKIGRRCKIKLTGIYPKFLQINYAFRTLKNLHSIDIGQANIVLKRGMDIELDFDMDYSKPTPFKLFAVKVSIPKFKIESIKTKAPFSMFLFRGYLQSIFRREMIKSLENWLLSSIVMIEDLAGLFRVNIMKWENTFQDEIFNARGNDRSHEVTSELYQFMCNISKMDTSTEEERRFQISLDESGGEPSYVLEDGFGPEIPWTSHKFDL